jgi:SLT domain-containing protein
VDGVLGIFAPLKTLITGVADRIGSLFGRGKNKVEVEYDYTGGGLPGHAEGGIFGKEHVARFAEDNRAEAVIPLTKPDRAKDILGRVVNYLNSGQSAIKKLDTGMTNRAQTAVEYSTNNTYKNYTITMPSTYHIKDTSGRPESVARAIERQENQRMRNLQGILNSSG